MAAVIFPDGARYSAPTWRRLEAALMEDPWNAALQDIFREELAHRAKVWSGTRITTEGTSRRFFKELERAGLLRIEEEESW
jgi:hypothetical protein